MPARAARRDAGCAAPSSRTSSSTARDGSPISRAAWASSGALDMSAACHRHASVPTEAFASYGGRMHSAAETLDAADAAYVREGYVTVEELCAGRTESPAQVRAWMAAG